MMNTSDGTTATYVVLGFDGGWRMRNLLAVAADEATRRQAGLALVTVSRPALDPALNLSGRQAAERRTTILGHKRLDRAAETVRSRHPQLPVTTHYLTEDQTRAAVHPLGSTQLLVVGTLGEHGREAFSLDSTSRLLLKATGCPVLVVPEPEPVSVAGRRRPVVVAAVGEHKSDAGVIQAAWSEALRHGWALELFHTYHDRREETPAQGLRRAADVVAQALTTAGVCPGEHGRMLFAQDDPATALSRLGGQAERLVIGSRPGALSGLVVGSVGREMLRSLSCPLLVIPDPVSDRWARPGVPAGAAHRTD
jgi:nucleotide-binding universal stress UspA family protein